MSNEAGAGGKGVFSAIVSALMVLWSIIPDRHKERAIDAVVEAFATVLGHFWEVFKRKAKIGVEPGAELEVSP